MPFKIVEELIWSQFAEEMIISSLMVPNSYYFLKDYVKRLTEIQFFYKNFYSIRFSLKL